MMEVSQEITNEVDCMILALEKAKINLEKKFKSIHDEFIDEAFQNFHNEIEDNQRYIFERWIRQTCNSIIEGLLAGDTKWLKQQSIISEYHWDEIKKIRMAILKANGGEIENVVILSQQREIETLKERLKYYTDHY
jgi:hypothetical protein